MAEMIELRKERMLPELEQMKRIQLFEDSKIRLEFIKIKIYIPSNAYLLPGKS